MNGRRIVVAVLMGMLLGVWCVGSAEAQLGSLKKKAEDKAKKEADKQVDEALEGKKEEPAQTEQTEAAQPAAETAKSPGQTAATEEPGAGPWLNYDFVPGNRVLFFEDFSKDVVGNFPQRLEFETGNMEIAEWNKIRWLRSSTQSRFSIALPEVLPEKFTIEFDLYTGSGGWNAVGVNGEDSRRSGGGSGSRTEQTQVMFEITNKVAGLRHLLATTHIAMGKIDPEDIPNIMHCRTLADGAYMKVYVNEKRVANVPKTNFIRTDHLYFDVSANDDRPLMLANFRIAASDKTIYDALIADGQVSTQGILFDSGSDKIRPESTPTLKEIGTMLADHADLKLMIEGHTDNVGDDASNQTLSDNRAASVKSYLIANFQIDAARLESKGYGESKPVAGNDTAEGRQNNRRVVLVKL